MKNNEASIEMNFAVIANALCNISDKMDEIVENSRPRFQCGSDVDVEELIRSAEEGDFEDEHRYTFTGKQLKTLAEDFKKNYIRLDSPYINACLLMNKEDNK